MVIKRGYFTPRDPKFSPSYNAKDKCFLAQNQAKCQILLFFKAAEYSKILKNSKFGHLTFHCFSYLYRDTCKYN